MKGIEGRVAVVTGAAGGIGGAVASRLAQAGAAVAVTDLDGAGAARVADSICAAGGRGYAWPLDITCARSVERTFGEIELALGPLDILIHAAAVFRPRRLLEAADDELDATLAVNVCGTFHCLRAAGRRMAARQRGAIVTVASQSAAVVRLEQGAYGASKTASTYLTKCLGLELAPAGVRCNIVHPGVTDTPLSRKIWDAGAGSAERHLTGDLARFRAGIPLGKIATLDNVTDAVIFLASDYASHMTMQDILVDGGASLIA